MWNKCGAGEIVKMVPVYITSRDHPVTPELLDKNHGVVAAFSILTNNRVSHNDLFL